MHLGKAIDREREREKEMKQGLKVTEKVRNDERWKRIIPDRENSI